MKTLSDVKTLEDFTQFVGLKPGESDAILKEVRENAAKLNACTRHQFRRPERTQPLFSVRHHCINCGGTMTGEKITYYAAGVLHAGKPFDVWIDNSSAQE